MQLLKKILLTIIALALSANFIYTAYRYYPLITSIKFPSLQQILSLKPANLVSPASYRQLASASPQSLFEKVQTYRSVNNLPLFETNQQICQTAQSLSPDNNTYSQEIILQTCPECIRATVMHVGNQAPAALLMEQLTKNTASNQLISNPEYNFLCVHQDQEQTQLMLFFAVIQEEGSQPQSQPQPRATSKPPPTTPPKNFTEDQLWQALIDYRHAHRKPDLLKDEKLCQYARKRVQDHQELFQDTPKEEYPNADKYPLDAHRGFMLDGESGYVFEATGKEAVAENLAYWPTATVPHHVIEWGWDTSTEGHRETQLTTNYSHACISGQDGFYVAIYGR